jgi:hypothetical protein
MNLGDFYALVSTTLRRGTTLDSFIPGQVQLAAQWMERNYSMKYMENFRLLQIQQNQRTIKMPPGVNIKAAKFVRLINVDVDQGIQGLYNYLNKVEPEDLQTLVSTNSTTDPVPRSYFIVGLNTLVLDTIPAIGYNGEAMFYEYTDWPVELTSQHPLLNIASDMMLAQTQLLMCVNILKDMRMIPAYKEARDEAVNTMTRAEDENKYGGESISMAFVPS